MCGNNVGAGMKTILNNKLELKTESKQFQQKFVESTN